MEKSLLELSATILAGRAQQQAMTATELAQGLQTVFETLQKLHQAENGATQDNAGASPSLSYLRQHPLESLQRNQVICLESGNAYKLLSNRHLAAFGLTPREYKKKWGIPLTMPLSARSLTQRCRKLAKERGMGQQLAAWRAQRRQQAS